jgi:hypothetical protein
VGSAPKPSGPDRLKSLPMDTAGARQIKKAEHHAGGKGQGHGNHGHVPETCLRSCRVLLWWPLARHAAGPVVFVAGVHQRPQPQCVATDLHRGIIGFLDIGMPGLPLLGARSNHETRHWWATVLGFRRCGEALPAVLLEVFSGHAPAAAKRFSLCNVAPDTSDRSLAVGLAQRSEGLLGCRLLDVARSPLRFELSPSLDPPGRGGGGVIGSGNGNARAMAWPGSGKSRPFASLDSLFFSALALPPALPLALRFSLIESAFLSSRSTRL